MKKSELEHCFDAIGPTERQQAVLWNKIVPGGARGRPILWRRRLVAAALAACLMLTTAMAAHHFGLDEKLRSFLQIEDPAQAELLAGGAYLVDKQVRNSGGTLDLKQVLGDGNHIYLMMDFTAPEGTALSAAGYRFGSSSPTITNYTGSYSYSVIQAEDTEMTDNRISLIMTITTQSAVAGETIRLSFQDLEAAETLSDGFKAVVPGLWEVSFPLDFQDCSVTKTLNSPISIQGHTLTLGSFSLSPLSVTFQAEGSHVRDSLYTAQAAAGDGYQFPVTLLFRDGTELTLDQKNSGLSYEMDEHKFFLTCTLNRVIDVSAVRSVTFCGTELLLE